MEFDVVAYLASKGLQGKRGSGSEVVYPCFMDCGERPDSRKKKLYYNTEEGFYHCFVCGASGGSYLLQKHFGDEPQRPLPGEDPHVRRKILDWAAEVGSVMLTNNEDVLLYLLNERGLSTETILERKLGYIGPQWSLTGSLPEEFSRKELVGTGLVWRDGPRIGQDFFYNHLLIPYLSRNSVVQIRGRAWGERGAKYVTGPGEAVRLFNADALDGAEDVLLCEGELDSMILDQHLKSSPDERARKIAVVGLPGTTAKPERFDAYLDDAKRIWIGMDADDAGRREAVKLKERFGARSRIVELPQGLPAADWSEYLVPIPPAADEGWKLSHPHAGHNWADVMRLLGTASGRRVFSMADAGAAWRNQRAVTTGIKTGYSQLDATLEPGLLPGQVVIVLAKTGSGKTILLCNLAFFMRSKRILFISLEMTREEVYERLRRIYLFWRPEAPDTEIEFALSNIYICDENRLSDRDFAAIIDEFEAEAGSVPEVCFVDYLGYFARGQKGNSAYEKTTNAVMQLKAVAKGTDPAKRFVIIAPSQVNRVAKEGKPIDMDDARDSVTGDTQLSLADGRRVPIRELVGQCPELICVDEDFTLTSRLADRVWCKGEREVLRLTTQTGRVIVGTPEHPLLTADRDWVHLRDLKVGDRVAVAATAPAFGSTSLPHAELLGLLQADGALTHSPVEFCKGDHELVDHVELLGKELGASPTRRLSNGHPAVSLSGGLGSPNAVTVWLKGLDAWGAKSPDRVVPRVVFSAPPGDVAAYLRGYWSGDGTVTSKGVAMTSASERMARAHQHLLSRFCIVSSLTREPYAEGGYKAGHCWKVVVRQAPSILRFARFIGLVGIKGRRLQRLAEASEAKRTDQRKIDMFPSNLWAEIHIARKALGLGWSALSTTGNPKRTSVVETRELSRDRLAWLAKRVGAVRLQSLAESPLSFDAVVSVEPVGRELVYDASVIGIHNFVGNDVVLANSGAIEETADFLLSIWRPDDALVADGAAQPSGKIKVTVLKSRHGGKDRTFTMVFDSLTLAIVDDHTPAAKRASEHNYRHWRGTTYDELRREELAPVQLLIERTAS